jgi:hypothetical protein
MAPVCSKRRWILTVWYVRKSCSRTQRSENVARTYISVWQWMGSRRRRASGEKPLGPDQMLGAATVRDVYNCFRKGKLKEGASGQQQQPPIYSHAPIFHACVSYRMSALPLVWSCCRMTKKELQKAFPLTHKQMLAEFAARLKGAPQEQTEGPSSHPVEHRQEGAGEEGPSSHPVEHRQEGAGEEAHTVDSAAAAPPALPSSIWPQQAQQPQQSTLPPPLPPPLQQMGWPGRGPLPSAKHQLPAGMTTVPLMASPLPRHGTFNSPDGLSASVMLAGITNPNVGRAGPCVRMLMCMRVHAHPCSLSWPACLPACLPACFNVCSPRRRSQRYLPPPFPPLQLQAAPSSAPFPRTAPSGRVQMLPSRRLPLTAPTRLNLARVPVVDAQVQGGPSSVKHRLRTMGMEGEQPRGGSFLPPPLHHHQQQHHGDGRAPPATVQPLSQAPSALPPSLSAILAHPATTWTAHNGPQLFPQPAAATHAPHPFPLQLAGRQEAKAQHSGAQGPWWWPRPIAPPQLPSGAVNLGDLLLRHAG